MIKKLIIRIGVYVLAAIPLGFILHAQTGNEESVAEKALHVAILVGAFHLIDRVMGFGPFEKKG